MPTNVSARFHPTCHSTQTATTTTMNCTLGRLSTSNPQKAPAQTQRFWSSMSSIASINSSESGSVSRKVSLANSGG